MKRTKTVINGGPRFFFGLHTLSMAFFVVCMIMLSSCSKEDQRSNTSAGNLCIDPATGIQVPCQQIYPNYPQNPYQPGNPSVPTQPQIFNLDQLRSALEAREMGPDNGKFYVQLNDDYFQGGFFQRVVDVDVDSAYVVTYDQETGNDEEDSYPVTRNDLINQVLNIDGYYSASIQTSVTPISVTVCAQNGGGYPYGGQAQIIQAYVVDHYLINGERLTVVVSPSLPLAMQPLVIEYEEKRSIWNGFLTFSLGSKTLRMVRTYQGSNLSYGYGYCY